MVVASVAGSGAFDCFHRAQTRYNKSKIKETNPMKSNPFLWPVARTTALSLLTLLALPAGAVTVLNHSFESPTLNNDGDFLPATSWTAFNVGLVTGGGSYNPTGGNFTGAGGIGTPLGADGTNVYSTASSDTVGNMAGAFQVLTGTKLTADTLYTLTVAIGDYNDLKASTWNLGISTSSMAFGSYLSTVSGSGNSLTNDAFNDFSVSYTATGAEAQNLDDLKVTFWATGAGDGVAATENSPAVVGGTNVPFDNVRFTAVPEPSAALLGGLGLLLLARRRRN